MKKLLVLFVISIVTLLSCHRGNEYSTIDIAKIEEIHNEAIDAININISGGDNIETAIEQCIAQICQSQDVERAYLYEDDIIIKYKSGKYSVIILTEDEQQGKQDSKSNLSDFYTNSTKIKGDCQITNHKVLIWEPSVDGLTYNSIHTGDHIENVFSSAPINFEIDHLKEEQCTVSSLTNLTEYGFVYIKAHGCTFKNDKGEDLSWIVTGEKCSQNSGNNSSDDKIVTSVAELYYDSTEEVHKFRKRDPTWGVSNKFISNKVNGVFNSPAVVFIQACHSFDNLSMRDAFIKDKHASVYLGYKHCVTHPFGYEKGMEFVTNMVQLHKNASDAYFDIEEEVDNTIIGYIIGLFGERAILRYSSDNSRPTYYTKERYVECPALNKRWYLYDCSFTPYDFNAEESSRNTLILEGSTSESPLDSGDYISIIFCTSRSSNLSFGTYTPFNVSDTSDAHNWEYYSHPMRFLTGDYKKYYAWVGAYATYGSYIFFPGQDDVTLTGGNLNVQYQNGLKTVTFSITDKYGRSYTGKYEE